jgi:hypothetical protein
MYFIHTGSLPSLCSAQRFESWRYRTNHQIFSEEKTKQGVVRSCEHAPATQSNVLRNCLSTRAATLFHNAFFTDEFVIRCDAYASLSERLFELKA